jgi:hypothetical protein
MQNVKDNVFWLLLQYNKYIKINLAITEMDIAAFGIKCSSSLFIIYLLHYEFLPLSLYLAIYPSVMVPRSLDIELATPKSWIDIPSDPIMHA